MAQEQQGIMGLPMGGQQDMAQAPQLSLEDSYDAIRQGLTNARPDVAQDYMDEMAAMQPMLDELNDEELDVLLSALRRLYEEEENYDKNVAELIRQGAVDPGDLPEQYDPEFLATFIALVLEAKRTRSATSQMAGAPMGMAEMPMPPQGFARGGIAEAARIVASRGRYGDTMLAHITPEEAKLLKARGGSGTINPETGLPEFFFKKIFKAVKKVVKSVGKAVKKVVKSPIGRIVATVALTAVLGPAGMGIANATMAPVLANMGVTALGGGDVKDVLVAGATSYLGGANSPLTGYVSKAAQAVGVTSPIAAQAITTGLVGTGAGLLTGKNLQDSLKAGLVEGAISAGSDLVMNRLSPQATTPAPVEERPIGSITPGSEAVPPVADVMQEADLRTPTSTSSRPVSPDTSAVTRNYADGTVTEQFVDARNAPVSPEQVIAAPAPVAPVSAAPAPAASAMPASAPIAPPVAATAFDMPTMPGATRPVLSPEVAVAQAASEADAGLGTSFYDRPQAPTGTGIAALNAAPTAPRPAAGVDDAYVPGGPGIGESLSDIGEGTKQLLSGDISAGASQIGQGIGDLFMPGPSRKQIMDFAKANNMSVADARYAIEPGFLRTYGPAAVAGIAGMAAMGGFTPKQPEETAEQAAFREQMTGPIDLSGDPTAYYIQGLPGVRYNERGEIIGGQSWGPMSQMKDIMGPSGYSYVRDYRNPYLNPRFMNMGGLAEAAGVTRQPSYDFMGQPQYLNQGGIAALKQGGYPRRVGQISGPGTEKSDSIPAMLSDGEFVMTAKAVRGAGNGSRREGAKRMYALMHKLERNASRG